MLQSVVAAVMFLKLTRDREVSTNISGVVYLGTEGAARYGGTEYNCTEVAVRRSGAHSFRGTSGKSGEVCLSQSNSHALLTPSAAASSLVRAAAPDDSKCCPKPVRPDRHDRLAAWLPTRFPGWLAAGTHLPSFCCVIVPAPPPVCWSRPRCGYFLSYPVPCSSDLRFLLTSQITLPQITSLPSHRPAHSIIQTLHQYDRAAYLRPLSRSTTTRHLTDRPSRPLLWLQPSDSINITPPTRPRFDSAIRRLYEVRASENEQDREPASERREGHSCRGSRRWQRHAD